jgi:hypothetical protein
MEGLGNNLSELRSRIQRAQEDLEQIGLPESALPEVINMTNMLRENEYLTKTDQKKTELISAYAAYTKRLEESVKSLLSIETDLRELIKAKATMTAHRPKTRKAVKKTKRKKAKAHKKSKRRKR